jgi:hypothetical protein
MLKWSDVSVLVLVQNHFGHASEINVFGFYNIKPRVPFIIAEWSLTSDHKPNKLSYPTFSHLHKLWMSPVHL